MTLTRRGRVVFAILFFSFMLGALALAGRFDAIDQCARFQADNNYTAALDAGCSFAPNADGEYPYTWTP